MLCFKLHWCYSSNSFKKKSSSFVALSMVSCLHVHVSHAVCGLKVVQYNCSEKIVNSLQFSLDGMHEKDGESRLRVNTLRTSSVHVCLAVSRCAVNLLHPQFHTDIIQELGSCDFNLYILEEDAGVIKLV